MIHLMISSADGIASFISAISAVISAVAVAVALYYNHQTQKQYVESLAPQLSMRLDNYNHRIFLLIQNTGGTKATDIIIDVSSIGNNGDGELMLDKLFSQTFELHPYETVQAMVALSGENAATGKLYPIVTVNVSYYIPGEKQGKRVKYSRTVSLSKIYDNKEHADVNMDLHEIKSSLKSTARASVRTANYLDGNQVCVFDEIDILANKSLRNDLCEAIKGNDEVIVCEESETINKTTSLPNE